METTSASTFVLSKIQFCLKQFNESSNKVEAVYYLKEILILLKKDNDPKMANFLSLIEKELNIEVGSTKWRRITISCPEIGFYDVVVRCLLREKELKEQKVYAPNNEHMSTWDYINTKIVSILEKYQLIYNQTFRATA